MIQPTLASCDPKQATLHSSSGIIASLVSQQTIYGTDACPWRIEAKPGQRINITLYNFNTVPAGPSGRQTTYPGEKQGKFCRAYATLREGDTTSQSATICSSSSRIEPAYMSRTNIVEVRLLNRNGATPDYFLMEYNGKSYAAVNIFLIFSRNSEASASEFLENCFPLYLYS